MENSTTLGKRSETNIYLVAAMLTYGGKLIRSGIDRSDARHIKFSVEGEEAILCRAEDDWYCDGGEKQEYPKNFLKCYSEHLRELKALIHA